jgi:hypothetical protein
MGYVIGIKDTQMGTCRKCQNTRRKETWDIDIRIGRDVMSDRLCLKHVKNALVNLIRHPLGQILIDIAKDQPKEPHEAIAV